MFGDTILTAAMVDRLTHKAHIINMNIESYRTNETLQCLKK
ncbi:MAG: ATP-binding protein [Salinivirgaceae bacterium]|nr:ATP-binding protein [Salinivirgaceae bacterium]